MTRTRQLALLPLALGVLLGGAFWAIGRRSGRLPADTDPQAPIRAAFVEIGLVSPGRWKFMLAALTVTEAGLTLRTFGTPFLRIPRAALAGRVTLGRGWVDPPYLEIPLDGSAQFLKYAWAYRLSPGVLKLRIYTAEAARLQAALG